MPPATRVLAFLLVFTALFILALILAVVAEFSDAKWIKTIISIGDRLGRLTFVAIATTFILVEGAPMLAAWIRREQIKEAREQGRVEGYAEGLAEGHVEGRAEERDAWRAWRIDMEVWQQRKSEAEREGRDFTELCPVPPDDD